MACCPKIMNTELHDELIRRMDGEQELRSQWVERPDDAQLISQMKETDLQNTQWLAEVIASQVLPGIIDVGLMPHKPYSC